MCVYILYMYVTKYLYVYVYVCMCVYIYIYTLQSAQQLLRPAEAPALLRGQAGPTHTDFRGLNP